MNCNDALEIMDRMIFEEIPAGEDLIRHVRTCPACNRAFADALKSREVIDLVRQTEPVLADAEELTGEIITAIRKRPERKTSVVPFLTRMLAAASVFMVLMLGYEQYGIVTKIRTLEMQSSEVKPSSRYAELRRLTATMNISEAGLSFSSLEKILLTGKKKPAPAVPFAGGRTDHKKQK